MHCRPYRSTVSDPDLSQIQASIQRPSHATNPQEAIQATEQLITEFSDIAVSVRSVSAIQQAAGILQNLTINSQDLSPDAQVESSQTLLSLSKQLTKALTLNSSLWDQAAPAATELFHLFDNIMKAFSINSSSWNSDQVDHLLYSSFSALEYIEASFLLHRGSEGPTLTAASSISSMIISRQNTSTFHLIPYGTPEPTNCKVSFPDSAALRSLLSEYHEIEVRVAALTFNPFKYVNEKEIVGSVAGIELSSEELIIEVPSIPETIEIILARNESTSASPAWRRVQINQLLEVGVNVTSEEDSVIIHIEPDPLLPVELYLGFQYTPNSTHFDLYTTFTDNDGGYTWVLSPTLLQNGIGYYGVTAQVVNSSTLEEKTLVNFSITTFATQCVFWNATFNIWEHEGCSVGPKTTATATQCLCHHLTFFGSTFLVMPRVVDIRDTVKLFANAANNPVALILLGILAGLYILTAIWSYMKDKQDSTKVKVTVLADNDAAHHSRYLVKVFTGYRRGASTTAKVILTLYGAEAQSKPHHLTDPGKAVFERGGVDIFLLKTCFLGELHSIRIWHDNSGPNPAWYVNRIMVIDLEAQQKWHFLCDSWLAADIDDCQLDRVFPAASRGDIMSFSYLMFSNSVERLMKDHLWLSVLTRCPWSPFTRVQRLSCCLTLLILSMLINLMFWNRSSDNDVPGEFKVTLDQLVISIQTSFILVPANLIIVYMFHLIQVHLKDFKHLPTKISVSIRPEPMPEMPAIERLQQDLQKMVQFLYLYVIQVLGVTPEGVESSESIPELIKTLSSLIHCHVTNHGLSGEQLQTEPLQLKVGSQGANSEQWDRGPNRRCISSTRQTQDEDNSTTTEEEGALTSIKVVSARHHHFLCYLKRALEILQSDIQNVIQSRLPIPSRLAHISSQLAKLTEDIRSKTLLPDIPTTSLRTGFPVTDYTRSRSLSSRLPRWFPYICWIILFSISGFCVYYLMILSLSLTKEKTTCWAISILLSLFQSIFIMPPVKTAALTVIQIRVLKKETMEDAGEEHQLQEVLAVLAKHPDWELSGWRDPTNPIYQPPPIGSFIDRRKLAQREKELYHFIRDFVGFITDGNSFLLGGARIRQLRIIDDPHLSFNMYNIEDEADYGAGWGPLPPNSTNESSIWHYQTEDELEGYPIWAKFGTYSGGGYVAELGANCSTATSVLSYLKKSAWLDRLSKAVFVEFSVYNANANLFCVTTLILETNGIGSFTNSADLQVMRLYDDDDNTAFSHFFKISFALLILYYVILQGLHLKEQKWKYFLKKMNQLDLCIIVIGCCMCGLYAKRIALRERDIARCKRNRSRFVSFYETGTVDSALGYVIAFQVSVATVKLWNLLNINPRLHLITSTLCKAWDEIKGFLLVIFVMLVAYSITCNLLFGWCIYNYRSFFNTAVTIVSLMIGIFNYEEVISLDPILGALLVTTCVVLLMFVIINIFLSAMLMVFSKQRQLSEFSKQEEIVELLLQKLSSLLGIRRKAKMCSPTAAEKKEDEK
ncbi:polycystin-1-like protein 3 isoform X2 [Lissotriton helveticus]